MSSKQQSQVGDYFGTFLDTLNDRSHSPESTIQSSSQSPSQSSAEGTAEPPTRAPDASALARPTSTLAMITRAVTIMSASDAIPVTDLQTQVGVGFAEFGELISNLHQLGMIAISGDPGAEEIGLTQQGRLFAQMA